LASGEDAQQEAPDGTGGEAAEADGPKEKKKSSKNKRNEANPEPVKLSPGKHLEQLEAMIKSFRTQEMSLSATLSVTRARSLNGYVSAA
jgi:hypothetical protein